MTSPQLKSKSNYEILDHLGGGAFGAVYKIRVKEDNKVYALKNVKLDRKEQPNALADADAEYKLLKKGIPNVLKSYGSHHEPKEMFLFTTDLMKMYFGYKVFPLHKKSIIDPLCPGVYNFTGM